MDFTLSTTADDRRHHHRRVTGSNNYYAQVGVVARDTLDAFSPGVSLFTAYVQNPPPNTAVATSRTVPGGTTSQPGSASVTLPYFIQITRVAKTLNTYIAEPGNGWTRISSTTLVTGETVYVGLN